VCSRARAEGAGATGETGFDLFLAAAALIGLAVGLLTIRLYPLPVRALGWVLARRRDLVPVLGLRNLGRQPTSGYLPLLILMLTVAIGTFSSVLQASIERSQVDVAWQAVGADFRIATPSGSALDPVGDPDDGGVEAVASVCSTRARPDHRTGALSMLVEPSSRPPMRPSSPLGDHAGPSGHLCRAGDGDHRRPAHPRRRPSRWPNGDDPLAVGDRSITINGQTLLSRRGIGRRVPGDRSDGAVRGRPVQFVAAAWQGSPSPDGLLRPRTPGHGGCPAREAGSGPDAPVDRATAVRRDARCTAGRRGRRRVRGRCWWPPPCGAGRGRRGHPTPSAGPAVAFRRSV
jgi:hypothetical protein